MKKEIYYCDVCEQECESKGWFIFRGSYGEHISTEMTLEHMCKKCSIKLHDIIEIFKIKKGDI